MYPIIDPGVDIIDRNRNEPRYPPPIERRSYPLSNEYLPPESDNSPSEFLGSYHSSLRPSSNSNSTVNTSFIYEQFTSPDTSSSPFARNIVSRSIRTSTYPQSSTPVSSTTSTILRSPQQPIGTQPEFQLATTSTLQLSDNTTNTDRIHTSQSQYYHLRTPLRINPEYINSYITPDTSVLPRLLLPEEYRNSRNYKAIYNILHSLPVQNRSREIQRLESPRLKLKFTLEIEYTNLQIHPCQTHPPTITLHSEPFPFWVTRIDITQPPHPTSGKKKEARGFITFYNPISRLHYVIEFP